MVLPSCLRLNWKWERKEILLTLSRAFYQRKRLPALQCKRFVQLRGATLLLDNNDDKNYDA